MAFVYRCVVNFFLVPESLVGRAARFIIYVSVSACSLCTSTRGTYLHLFYDAFYHNFYVVFYDNFMAKYNLYVCQIFCMLKLWHGYRQSFNGNVVISDV